MESLNIDTEKLERLVGAVNSEVDKTIADVLSDAESARNEILREAEGAAAKIAAKRLEEGEKLLSSKYVRVVAKAELDAKKEVLLFREALVKQVFENVAEKLLAFRETAEYLPYLGRLLKGEKVDSDTVICLMEDDMPHAEKLSAFVGASCAFKADASIHIGGLSLYYPKKGVLVDKTMDAAIGDARGEFILK